MRTSKLFAPTLATAAMLLGATSIGGAATAGPLSPATATSETPAVVQPVRHGRWGGVGIYIGPGYGYYPSYGYYDDYDYYPRRSYYRDRYDRPYRHSRRWTKERFEHPLGRR